MVKNNQLQNRAVSYFGSYYKILLGPVGGKTLAYNIVFVKSRIWTVLSGITIEYHPIGA
jgi:hypothetical protein